MKCEGQLITGEMDDGSGNLLRKQCENDATYTIVIGLTSGSITSKGHPWSYLGVVWHLCAEHVNNTRLEVDTAEGLRFVPPEAEARDDQARPPYNHTRGDSAETPCPKCAATLKHGEGA